MRVWLWSLGGALVSDCAAGQSGSWPRNPHHTLTRELLIHLAPLYNIIIKKHFYEKNKEFVFSSKFTNKRLSKLTKNISEMAMVPFKAIIDERFLAANTISPDQQLIDYQVPKGKTFIKNLLI